MAALCCHLHCSWSSVNIHRGLQKVWNINSSSSDFFSKYSSTNYLGAATDVRAGLALFYVLTNVTILAKCPLGNRHTNHQHMIEVPWQVRTNIHCVCTIPTQVTWIWSLLYGLVLPLFGWGAVHILTCPVSFSVVLGYNLVVALFKLSYFIQFGARLHFLDDPRRRDWLWQWVLRMERTLGKPLQVRSNQECYKEQTWHSPRLAILASPWVFHLTSAILVALGPLTHLALVMLQKIIVAEDKKRGDGKFG